MTFACSFDWQLQYYQFWLTWVFGQTFIQRNKNHNVVILDWFGFTGLRSLGLGDLLGHSIFYSWFNFCEELDLSKCFFSELFWNNFPITESFENTSFKNGDLLFPITLWFDSTCLFSKRDLISSFKACFASSFGNKISYLLRLVFFLLRCLDFGMGLGEESVELCSWHLEHCPISNLSILTPWGRA